MVEDSVLIRLMQPEDAVAAAKLHQHYKRWFEGCDITSEFMLDTSRRPDFKFYVAESETGLVGFCGILYQSSVGRAEVGPIAVSPSWSRRGVGRLLLQAVLDLGKEKRLHRLIAKVKSENQPALDFFGSHGFVEEALLTNFTRAGEDVKQLVLFPSDQGI